MANLYEPKIVYARELENNRFMIVLRMQKTFSRQMTYIGGIAVIGDIHSVPTVGNPIVVLTTKMTLNWLEYKEVDPSKFIAEDMKNTLQNTLQIEQQKQLPPFGKQCLNDS